jgi:ABC-2 type transport system permease protein
LSLALLEYELRLRRRVVIGWGLLVVLWIALIMWYWSTLEEPAVEELQRLIEQSPEWFIRFFAKGSPVAFTYQVYYVLEHHVVVYVLLLGALAAYLGAGAVVDDVLGRTGGLAMLATPTGRMGVLLVRLAALAAVAVVLTLTSLITSTILQLVLVGGGELWWLVKLHLAGLPYLVACTTLGLLAGSTLPASIAKPTAAGLVLAMYVAEMTTKGTRLEGVSLLTITHYYPALEIALNNITPVTETATLIVIALALTTLSIVFYNRKDLPV